MEKTLSSFLNISINFAESHTFFPKIIVGVLAFLLVLIALFNGLPYVKDILSGKRKVSFSSKHIDKIRLFGTLVLTIAYFLLMDYVGSFFPNTGYGFLLVTIPFMLLLSLLYVHELNRRKFVIIVLNAVIAPSLSWVLLGQVLKITLP